ncbi:MAG: methyltransferase domain-containing protein [Thermoleophilaceae bacterium]|jgi:SAM-dependent methyltransferase|nr:methyltransferase domain-containing protein [Thermoleophilaceae bacterium]
MVATAGQVSALDRAGALLAPTVRDQGQIHPAGYLELIGAEGPESTGTVQDLMLTAAVPRIYERWWRPALGRVMKGVFGPGMADEHRIAQTLLDLGAGGAVLDVACGTGNFTRGFARAVGPEGLAVGIDVSETMLARAVSDTQSAGLADRTAYVRGNAQEMPFVDGVFEGVCCFAALHLFADPSRALDRMTALLTPGGRIAIFTSVRGQSVPLRTWESVAGARSGMRLFERDEVTRGLERRGFEDVRQLVTGVTQFVGGTRAG